jgi:hypothetical protein
MFKLPAKTRRKKGKKKRRKKGGKIATIHL